MYLYYYIKRYLHAFRTKEVLVSSFQLKETKNDRVNICRSATRSVKKYLFLSAVNSVSVSVSASFGKSNTFFQNLRLIKGVLLNYHFKTSDSSVIWAVII